MFKKIILVFSLQISLNLFSQNYFSTNMDEIIIKDKVENENLEF
jgi:hypothetical protein